MADTNWSGIIGATSSLVTSVGGVVQSFQPKTPSWAEFPSTPSATKSNYNPPPDHLPGVMGGNGGGGFGATSPMILIGLAAAAYLLLGKR